MIKGVRVSFLDARKRVKFTYTEMNGDIIPLGWRGGIEIYGPEGRVQYLGDEVKSSILAKNPSETQLVTRAIPTSIKSRTHVGKETFLVTSTLQPYGKLQVIPRVEGQRFTRGMGRNYPTVILEGVPWVPKSRTVET